MPPKARYKRPTREQLRKMTPEQVAAHKAELNRQKQRRWRRRQGKKVRAERAKVEGARLYTWERLLPYIVKLEDGCWLWTGSFQLNDGGVRPIALAGVYGREYVDHIVCCLHRGRPPPRCTAKRVCETIGCVAPEHIVWSNRVVETAKVRRRHHEQEKLAGRVE